MSSVLQELKESPRLPAYVRELEDLLASEAERREQFYKEIRDDQKAEFINGEIIMHSPSKLRHSLVVGNLFNLLHNFVVVRKLGVVVTEKTLVCLTRNDYEPDISFFRAQKAAAFKPEQFKFPAPDFIVEVLSNTTEHIDRGVKLVDYAAHGVSEYWLVDAEAQAVEQYRLEGEQFVLHRRLGAGDQIKSLAVSGFEIPVAAIFDEQENQKALRGLLENAESPRG